MTTKEKFFDYWSSLSFVAQAAHIFAVIAILVTSALTPVFLVIWFVLLGIASIITVIVSAITYSDKKKRNW